MQLDPDANDVTVAEKKGRGCWGGRRVTNVNDSIALSCLLFLNLDPC